MLEQRHDADAFDTELSVADEERIRADERRRVLAELAGDDDGHNHEVDWRSAPPPFGEAPAADPPATDDPVRPDDPRRWDVPDDRWDREHRDDRFTPAERTAEVMTRTDEVPIAVTQVVDEGTVVERGASAGQLLIALAGASALAIGIFALARAGLDAPLSAPVVSVLGWDHTAMLGLLEVGAGVVMLLASLRAGLRWLGGLAGLAMIAGGVLVVADVDTDIERWITDELAAERTFGWVAIAIGAVAVLGALIPRTRRRVTRSRSMLV